MQIRYGQRYNLDSISFINQHAADYLMNVDDLFIHTFLYMSSGGSFNDAYELMCFTIDQLLNFYNQFLSSTRDTFYQTRVDSDIDLEAAMCYITNKLVKKLSIKTNFTRLCKKFTPNKKSFVEFLKILKVSQPSLAAYCISGLKVFTKFSVHAPDQWKYWFCDDCIFFNQFDVRSLNYDLYDAVESRALRPIIESILPEPLTLDQVLEDIRNRIYMVGIFPGSYGMTSFNLNIYIGEIGSGDELVCAAVSLVVFIHELGHYIPRLTCRSYQDIKDQNTPPNSQEPDAQKGERVFDLEKKVFGMQIERLSRNASSFLFDNRHYSDTIQEFQNKFAIANSLENGTVYEMNRGSGFFRRNLYSYYCVP